MDPNETLAEIRRYVEILKDGGDGTPEDAERRAEVGEMLALAFDDLDSWLLAKGFVPAGWGPR
jgi:hypothetical protein